MLWLLPVFCILRTASALWPAPSQYTPGNQYVKLHDSFSIVTRGGFSVPDDLRAAMKAAEEQIRNDKMQPLEVDLYSVEAEAKRSKHILYFLELQLKSDTQNVTQLAAKHTSWYKQQRTPSISSLINQPFGRRDESYTLDVTLQNPVASLTASTVLGLLRGLQTFTQLVYTTSDSQCIRYIKEAPLKVQDKPAYPVRGLLLDTARNYYPVKDIKRTLNAMSWAKMN